MVSFFLMYYKQLFCRLFRKRMCVFFSKHIIDLYDAFSILTVLHTLILTNTHAHTILSSFFLCFNNKQINYLGEFIAPQFFFEFVFLLTKVSFSALGVVRPFILY